jgi:UDP-N-acetylglucosamine:LPS N-acetylglucosamine transferase
MYAGIRAGLGQHLIEKLSKRPLPMVCTFFYVAFMAEEFDYPGDVWCVTTDADISRAWAPLHPKKSRIRYFAANGRCVERLKLYGVRSENIYLTGFPLPPEIVDGPEGKKMKRDLLRRLCVLDPQGVFRAHHAPTIDAHLGAGTCPVGKTRGVPTVMFAVGGAGAQAKLALVVLRSLAPLLRKGEIRLILMAGARPALGKQFLREAQGLRLKNTLEKTLLIRSYDSRRAYFDDFVRLVSQTDILWTKPSELSFYTGLGLPVLMAPPLGSQEEYNRLWLSQVGGGVFEGEPRYTHEWLPDWIASGAFARMAWNGYVEAPTHGTYRIENALFGKRTEVEMLPLIV